ncbi:zinc-dependent alcohol dehydrogenase family protein [Mucilaginibacter lappiensis]|uniref:Propanol-preferring alcohol dehydrogenase n=1 Tax=Mucilaginibacter lappiensis TaxID=354630 RepID=A0A1N7GEU1_9SPHI|nr:zinc-dependent alcohol dehydrogenase family protein [Mucilaginibacter lappiensis]MBB6113030.1 propanol-preferring alcohol dehydrogenase [Mucilaginibacter lappiensis]MBB6130685.1 propanol-preferring alcohol dehydrogenase [Mucilaginibacter lappiensis]SIS11127.1 alcohol dehydrogenase, propanol-preferring [Mucilaginibacter lappiensis]
MKKSKNDEPDIALFTMRAMVMEVPGQPLIEKTLPLPVPSDKQVLVKIIACGVCRTDLHIMDSELDQPKLPLIPGHEIVGTVVKLGNEVTKLKTGDLVGIPWLGFTCGHCRYCKRDQENLCENALFTGYTMDGGYAEYTVAFEDFCFSLPPIYGNPSGAPLLCAGLIGYRSYSMAGPNAEKIGLYGFGAAAHILIQVALHQSKEIYAFTKDGDLDAQKFAKELGATWAGDSTAPAPGLLDASIIFAPAGSLVPKALKDLDKGGSVICGGIHMSDIPSFPYPLLWEERVLRSVANLTRKDGRDFLELAALVPVKTETKLFPLDQANEALAAVRNGEVRGAVVLVM